MRNSFKLPPGELIILPFRLRINLLVAPAERSSKLIGLLELGANLLASFHIPQKRNAKLLARARYVASGNEQRAASDHSISAAIWTLAGASSESHFAQQTRTRLYGDARR